MATEPNDDMPKITLERDDLESFQRTRAKTNKKTNASENKTQEESKSSNANSPSWIMFIFILIVLGAAATYWSLEQQKALVQAQERISDLERRLSATGEELDQSAVALQVKVTELSKKTEELWEQMDKLWASAWRRNQSEIADLNSELKKVSSTYDSKFKNQQDINQQQIASASSIDTKLNQLTNNLQATQETQELIKRTSQTNEQQLSGLREKLISTALGNNNLTNKVDELESKLMTLEKSLSKVSSEQPSPP